MCFCISYFSASYAHHIIDLVHHSLYTWSQSYTTHASACSFSRPRDPLNISLCYGPESIVLILAGIDRAVSHCKRCLLHHTYMCLNPFHLSLSVLCSNSRRRSYLCALAPFLMHECEGDETRQENILLIFQKKDLRHSKENEAYF